jgi:hypothetical protein
MTLRGRGNVLRVELAARWFFVGMVFYFITCLQCAFHTTLAFQRIIHFSDWVVGHAHLVMFGVFGFWLIGGIVYLWPRLVGRAWWSPALNLSSGQHPGLDPGPLQSPLLWPGRTGRPVSGRARRNNCAPPKRRRNLCGLTPGAADAGEISLGLGVLPPGDETARQQDRHTCQECQRRGERAPPVQGTAHPAQGPQVWREA